MFSFRDVEVYFNTEELPSLTNCIRMSVNVRNTGTRRQFLATGNTLQDIGYYTCITANAISSIVHWTVEVIIIVLEAKVMIVSESRWFLPIYLKDYLIFAHRLVTIKE